MKIEKKMASFFLFRKQNAVYYEKERIENMRMIVTKQTLASSNQRNTIHIQCFSTEQKNVGVVVILHGMVECKEIYFEFAEYLAQRQYYVITYDHIGHGSSINHKDEQGFFANEQGEEYLTQDAQQIIAYAKSFQLPVFLYGHSMGSLIARNYMASSKQEVDGVILSGTIGPQWAIEGAIQLAEYMIAQKGPRYRSRKLNELVTTVSDWKFGPVEYPLEWTTRNKEYICTIQKDKKMNFIFTAAGFRDVFVLVKKTGQKENVEKIPKALPIFLVSGGDDLLGEYGEGVKRLEDLYRKVGIRQVSVKIYEKARHSLMQEINREEVMKDIYDWIEAVRLAKKE